MTVPETAKHKNKILPCAEAAALFLLTIFFAILCRSHPWRGDFGHKDSNVYVYMARAILRGDIPYVDAFDNKGPVLYLLETLGYGLGGWTGIWVLEVVALFTTFWCVYKIARLAVHSPLPFVALKKNETSSDEDAGPRAFARRFSCALPFVAVIYVAAVIYACFEGGNFTEEYALPFVASSLYIFLHFFYTGCVRRWQLVLCGAGFAAVALIRMNMAALWVVMAPAVLLYCLWKKQGRQVWTFLLWFLLGAALVAVPVFAWLILRGAWAGFVDAYLLYNAGYIENFGASSIWTRRREAAVFFLKMPVFLFPAILAVWNALRKRHWLPALYLLLGAVCLGFAALSGRPYPHYAMVLAPLAAYSLALSVAVPGAVELIAPVTAEKQASGSSQESTDRPSTNDKRFSRFVILRVLVALLACALAVPAWFEVGRLTAEYFPTKGKKHRDSFMQEVA